jgi:hypothetical protein
MKTEPIFLQDTSGWSKGAASFLNRGPQPPGSPARAAFAGAGVERPSAEHIRLRLNILIDERS